MDEKEACYAEMGNEAGGKMNQLVQENEENIKDKVNFSTDCAAQERALIMSTIMGFKDEREDKFIDLNVMRNENDINASYYVDDDKEKCNTKEEWMTVHDEKGIKTNQKVNMSKE